MKGFLRSFVISASVAFSPWISKAQEWVATQCEQILQNALASGWKSEVKERDETMIAQELLDATAKDKWPSIFDEALKKLSFEWETPVERWDSLRKEYSVQNSSIDAWGKNNEFFEKYRSPLADLLKKQFHRIHVPGINAKIHNGIGKFLLGSYARHDAVFYSLLNGVNPNHWLEHAISQLNNGSIRYSDFDTIVECHNATLEAYQRDFLAKTPSSWESAIGSELHWLERYTEVLQKVKEEWIDYHADTSRIYFSVGGIFLESFDLHDQELSKRFKDFFEAHTYVWLNDYVALKPQTELNIGLMITHSESIQNIEVRKKYALLFQQYSQGGITFIVEDDQREKTKILAVHGGRVIAEVQNEHEYSLGFFFRSLASFDPHSPEKIKLENKVTPKSKRIEFINHVYEETLVKKGQYPEFQTIIKLAKEHGLGGQEAITIAFQIYAALDNKWQTIFPYIFTNPDDFLLSWSDFLKKYDVELRDYGAIRNAYTNYYFGTVNGIIQKNRNISAHALLWFIENIYQMDLSRGLKTHFSEEQWVPMLVKALLTQALWNNPELFDTPEMKLFFETFPHLQALLSTGQSTRLANSRILSGSQWWTWLDLANSIRISGEYDIFLRIRDMQIAWIEAMTEKEKWEIKLAIARNLAIAHMDDTEAFLIRFDGKREAIIQDELQKILKMRQSISLEAVFQGKSLYHLAHFWQWIDAFWTPWTQAALNSQLQWGKYALLDAEVMMNRKLPEKNGKIQSFYDAFIEEKNPAVFLAEWHANAEGFLILDDFTRTDKLEIIKEGHTRLILDPKKLADIIVKRSERRHKEDITWKDIFIFAACKWDFVMNVVSELHKRKNEYSSKGIKPPIIITAAEAWENSLFRPWDAIPYEVLRVALSIGETTPTTFGSFLEKQHAKEMWSNPWVFYPDENGTYMQLF